MKIQIAPNLEEIVITDRSISTKWNGGITYHRSLKKFRELLGDDAIANAFQEAIALSSYYYQIRKLMDLWFSDMLTVHHADPSDYKNYIVDDESECIESQ